MKFLTVYKSPIDEHLIQFLQKKKKELSRMSRWGTDAVKKLLSFVIAGKTIRGSLVLYAYSLFQKGAPESVLHASAALELIHSGFLIHDDIMDQDDVRRGNPSMHMRYARLGDKHFGTSMGINLADLCFFLAYELIPLEVTRYVSREWASVVVAQMHDVSGAKTPEEKLTVYRYKTARYTFSVPLSIGARLAGAPRDTIKQLETLGEYLGMLYQIRDDELDNTKNALSDALKKEFVTNANKMIDRLRIETNHKEELVQLLAFCNNRQS